MPSIQGICITSDKAKLLKNNKNSLLYCGTNNVIVDTEKRCKDYKLKFETQILYGTIPDISSSLNQNNSILGSEAMRLQGNIQSDFQRENIEKEKRIFKMMDKNKDLEITTKDVNEFFIDQGIFGINPEEWIKFRNLNGNTDKLTFAEFMFSMKSNHPEDAIQLKLQKLLATICFNKCLNGIFEISLGMQSTLLRDRNFRMRGGWYKENSNQYQGGGIISHIANIPFGSNYLQGVKTKYKDSKKECYIGIYSPFDQSFTSNSSSNGFLSSQGTILCDTGIVYKNKKLFDSIFSIVFQRMQNYGYNKNPIRPLFLSSVTSRAVANARTSMSNDPVLCSYTFANQYKIKGISINGSISYIPIQRENKEGNLLLWSLGCRTTCKKIKCIPDIFSPKVYGANISTPILCQKSILPKSNRMGGSDGKVINCEVSVLYQLCGLNIPIFFNLHNTPQPNNSGDDQGKIFIAGIRPFSIVTRQFKFRSTREINCERNNIEGGGE